MKHIIIIGIVSIAVCGAVVGSYFVGYVRGIHYALQLQPGTLIGTLDALDQIRAGDVAGSTKTIEELCFSSADTVYGDFQLRQDFSKTSRGKRTFDDLLHYRQTYRTNSADWTPAEQILEKQLASMRQP